jgi:acyl-homoserine-lactone acylase
MHHRPILVPSILCSVALLAACGSTPPAGTRTATIARTAHGVAHISAPDVETLAYGTAYAHAQDNLCQTAQQLVTIRGERARFFGGGAASAQLGLRLLPNEQIDFFIAAHMDDGVLEGAWAKTSADAQRMARGYVAGYNRLLAERAGDLPAACKGQPWVRPMTMADFRRLSELTAVQAGIAALADGMLGARPPAAGATATAPAATIDLADAAQAMREAGLLDSPYGSNAWAFGRDVTAGGRGVLLGNPHFPWVGVNRFWQMHLTVPGVMDVMGAAIGHSPVVQIGFNKDVAWSHTVSTGKRFTLHELTLVAGDPTAYVVDGQSVKMTPRSLSIDVRGADGTLQKKTTTVWSTRWGPVIVAPRAGLNWTVKNAYALQDANSGNARSFDAWFGFARATRVEDMRQAMAGLGVPWVNTIAADRHGQALYADVSVVPDVDAAQLERCAPGAPAKGLLRAAGLVVLDGSKSACDWRRDAASPVPGLTPIARMPLIQRSDWVQNSNDSFVYTHPAVRLQGISPLVGDAFLARTRTRSSLLEVPRMLAEGKLTPQRVQQQLFGNRNFIGHAVMPDLLAACATQAPASGDAREGCAALRGWDRNSDAASRGAHLFREFWRNARGIAGVHRTAFDPADPVAGPAGLKMDDAAVADKVWQALAQAVAKVKTAGFALDAPLGQVQRPAITEADIGLHGGDEIEGVLNNLGDRGAPGIGTKGIRIDYGTSYVQAVGFDERGPVARAILTYGQSTDPASPHATDQLRLFAAKQWPALPFHAEDVAKARIGEPLKLVMP